MIVIASPIMAKTKKTTTKGKRYTTAEKQEVLDYVASVDAEKGRGGVAAAARQFGITPLTVTAWKKRFGTDASSAPARASSKEASVTASRGATTQSRALHRLGEILDAIEAHKAKIVTLEKEYAKLKKKV